MRIIVPLQGIVQGRGGLILGSLIPCALLYFFQFYLKRNRSSPPPDSPSASTANLPELTGIPRTSSRTSLPTRGTIRPVPVSSRATAIARASDSAYYTGWKKCLEDPYHPTSNPDGIIQLGLSENHLSLDLIEEWLAANLQKSLLGEKRGNLSIFGLATYEPLGGLMDLKMEMFCWQRPDDLPPSEPSEEVIWEAIDRRDPQDRVDVRDRLEQHQDMLQGRDTFHDFFTHFSLLPECSEDSVEFEDPDRWVTSLRLQCGEYHPLESLVAQVGTGTCDVLELTADVLEPVGQSSLLSHRQLQQTSLEWPRDSTVGQVQSPVSGYVCWARYVLQTHRETLLAAGIYEAVYASLFDYGRLPTSWARGLVEFWDGRRSTLWVGAEEFTVTLSDLQTVSGLPVFGRRFEECVPPDEQLFCRVPSADGDRRGRLMLPDVFPRLLQHYRQTYRSVQGLPLRFRATMPADVWVSSFLQEGYLFSTTALLEDLFGFGLQRGTPLSEQTAEPCSSTGCTFPGLAGVDEQMLLAGFLSLWLSTFVLPLRTGYLRCSLLLAASQLSEGQRLALAPAVLARVYRVLRTISESGPLEVRDSVLPWQYLYAWVHLHVQGAFSCLETPAYFLQRGYPTVLQLSQASSTLESERIRLFFFAPHLVADRFSLVYQPDSVSLPAHLRGTVIVDGVDSRGRRTLLQRRRSLPVVEYFISLRPGWLCHRLGGFVTLEGYQPNRVARQFGFSQTTAYDGRPLVPGVPDVSRMDTVPPETRFYAAALSWLHLLRLGTGSSFLLALLSSSTGVSYTRLSWVRLSFGATLEHGARRYERRVRELGGPRRHRPHRGFTDVSFERGTDTEAYATVGTVTPSPVRTSGVPPEPSRTGATRSPRRQVGSERASSSRMTVDVHSLLGDQDGSSVRPRRSDFTGYSTFDPPDDFSFPAFPGESFWPGESSGAGAASPPPEFFGVPSHTPTVSDLVPPEFSFFSGGHLTDFAGPSSAPASHPADSTSPSTAPEGTDYTSEIPCHIPFLPNSKSAEWCSQIVGLLRDLLSSVDPRVSETWVGFVPAADRLLGLLASFGVSPTELVFWESLCREVEYHVRRLRPLSVLRTRATLSELQERVARRREQADDVRDRLDRSAEALRRHRQSSSTMSQEFDRLTTRMQSLWRDVRQVMSDRFHLREGRGRRDRLTRREEQRYQSLHQEMVAADSALTQAIEELQTAQLEFQTIEEVTGYLDSLYARLY